MSRSKMLTSNPRSQMTIALQPYPTADDGKIDETVEKEFSLIQSIVEALRAARKEYGIKDNHACDFHFNAPDQEMKDFITKYLSYFTAFLKTHNTPNVDMLVKDRKPGTVSTVVSSDNGPIEMFIDLKGIVTKEAEFARIDNSLKKVDQDLAAIEKKMSSKGFMDRAPKEVVDETLRLKAKCEELKERLLAARAFAEELELQEEPPIIN